MGRKLFLSPEIDPFCCPVCAREVDDATRLDHEICASIVSDWMRDGDHAWSHEVLSAGLEFGSFSYERRDSQTPLQEIHRKLRRLGRRPDWKRVREALRDFLEE